MTVVEIAFIVIMILWFVGGLQLPQAVAYGWATSWLPFIAVLLLGLHLFVPGLR